MRIGRIVTRGIPGPERTDGPVGRRSEALGSVRDTEPALPGRADATDADRSGLWYLMDDAELTQRLARDLDGTFEALVRAHVDRCYAIALRILGDPHDAEEVAQDALVRAYHALASYQPDRIRELRLKGWLATIVANLARNRLRRHRPATTPLAPLIEVGLEPVADD